MALSGFIKQLLETDSVFGSRAKKLTGLNDRESILILRSEENYRGNVILDLSVNSSAIQIIIFSFSSNGTDLLPIPSFLQAGNFIRLGISNFATATDQFSPSPDRPPELDRIAAGKVDGAVLQITRVFPFNPESTRPIFGPRLFIECDPTVGDAPRLQALIEESGFDDDDLLENFGPVDLALDARIASLIDDQQIAAFSSRGSTRYNLDNIGVAETQDRGGGIAARYAAHYHGDKLINIVSNFRDDINNPLYGLEINESQLDKSAFNAVYFPDVALQYLYNLNIGTSTNIRIDYSDDTSTQTVATYGYVGTRGSGSVILNGLPTPFTSTTNRGTRVTAGDTTFEYDLPEAMATGLLRRWVPAATVDPSEQLHEEALQLRDIMRVAGGSNFSINVVTLPTATSQHVGILGSRDDENNVDVTYQRATLAPFDVITTTNVRGSSSPRPISGIEFKTFEDLFNVLAANTRFDVNVVKEGSLNTITFSTDVPKRKEISFITPSNSANIFETPSGDLIFKEEIGNQAQNQVIIPAEIVLDNRGNIVFSRENPI